MTYVKSGFFTTSDFCLAITLITKGHSVAYLDKKNPRRIIFCFDQNSEIEKTVSEYWSKDLKVSPKDFYSNQRLLKSRMQQEQTC